MSTKEKIEAWKNLFESLKELATLSEEAKYENILNTLNAFRKSEDWQEIKTTQTHDGGLSEDITTKYEFYSPKLNLGVNIYLNPYAKNAFIRQVNINELKSNFGSRK